MLVAPDYMLSSYFSFNLKMLNLVEVMTVMLLMNKSS